MEDAMRTQAEMPDPIPRMIAKAKEVDRDVRYASGEHDGCEIRLSLGRKIGPKGMSHRLKIEVDSPVDGRTLGVRYEGNGEVVALYNALRRRYRLADSDEMRALRNCLAQTQLFCRMSAYGMSRLRAHVRLRISAKRLERSVR